MAVYQGVGRRSRREKTAYLLRPGVEGEVCIGWYLSSFAERSS